MTNYLIYVIINTERGKERPSKREVIKMTRTEILNKIDELETARFYLAMKDHWNREDFARDAKWCEEVMALKKVLDVKKEYTVEFIRPNIRNNDEERVIVLATFKNLDEAKEFGYAYQEQNNENATRRQRGYYNIKTIEII